MAKLNSRQRRRTKNTHMKYLKTLLDKKTLMVLAIFSMLMPLQELSAQARRPAAKPAARPTTANRPTANKSTTGNRTGNVSNSGNRTNTVGSNNNRGNNSNNNININIDNSKDVRINNSRNTVVRHNPRPYPRPPYVYGGFHYRCYHPYYFHPYRPFVWGPAWHPWGFFITTLAVTAILISVDNIEPPAELDLAMAPAYGNDYYALAFQTAKHGPFFSGLPESPWNNNGWYNAPETVAGDEYWYDAGVFYLKGDGGYTVVSAPIGAKIKTLPSGYETITLDDNTKNYYYGGTFYEKTSAGYTVVAPVAGSVVTNVSEGGEEVKLGDVTYVKLGETYYQPIQLDGKNKYEVVDVEEAK
jgi:Family of unknown function (DUF6515)